MKRREFLRNTGWFVVGASVLGSAACGDDDDYSGPGPEPEPQPAGTYSFPQGVASGDPRETTVVLWTRVALARSPDASFASVRVQVQVSADEAFSQLIVDQVVAATGASDHTVRVLVTGLSANTTYYYRFVADSDKISGRTRTAPAADADVQINFAWMSCQDYGAGHYGSYRQLLIDDAARPEADKIHAVIHLGDMIYETRGDGFQGAIDESFQPIMLTNRDGKPRAVGPFPSDDKASFARTVDDYRHLYRTFLSDPDLIAARARWPFICVWDDHEFTDDSWQSQANYIDTNTVDEASQRRKVAANQAWFEYTPAHLSGAPGVPTVSGRSKDFVFVEVEDEPFTPPDDDNLVDEPNNLAAIDSLVIFRSLRFGKHVELVMTDERSFRSDHAVPEELTVDQLPIFFAARSVLPIPIVNAFDQGKTAGDGVPPSNVLGIPNPRAQSPVGTMLGTDQKKWWKETMKKSNATWKLWGNEVPLMRMRVVQGGVQALVADRVLAGDAWDGYPTERNELMTFLRTESVSNVVVLTGDVHAGFAGTVKDDYDAPPAAQQVVACELIAPGASSNSLFSFFESATRAPTLAGLRGIITVDATARGGASFTENLNMLLMHGTRSALAFASGQTEAVAFGLRDADANAHMMYADTNAQGYGYIKVNGAEVKSTIITINRPIAAPSDAGPGIKRAATFTIPKDNPAGMEFTSFTGTRQFGLQDPPLSTTE